MPNSISYNDFHSTRRYGIELEVGDEVKKKSVSCAISNNSHYKVFSSKYALTSNNNYWHVKDDATCGRAGRSGPKGVEIASFIASGMNDLNHIIEVADHLRSVGCKVNGNCGLHVHAEVADLSVEQIAVVVAWWIKCEMALSLALPLCRYQNEYCKFHFSPFLTEIERNGTVTRVGRYAPLDLWQKMAPKNLNLFENSDRRFNLNLVNYARCAESGLSNRKTLELRWPEGTLCGDDIFGWTVLFLSFIENAKALRMPTDLKLLGLRQVLGLLGLGHKGGGFTILGEHLHRLKSWLCERIVENAIDSSHFYSHFRTINFQKENVRHASAVLDDMWSPIKKYI